ARSSPHFHVCAECGQNWRHATGCGEPLRTALPECPWCHGADRPIEADAAGVGVANADTVEVDDADPEAVEVASVEAKAAEAKASLRERPRTIPSFGARPESVGRRIRPMARAIGMGAVVFLPIAIAIVLRGHSAFKSPGEVGEEPAREERLAVPSPAPAPS